MGYTHRDIKPENFRFNEGKAYLIDLGSAKQYRDSEGNHIPRNMNAVNRGSLLFSSINAL